MVDGVGEEICVDEDAVGGLESGVVVEEHGGGHLGAVYFWVSWSLTYKRKLIWSATYTSRITPSPFIFFSRCFSASATMFFLSRESR